MYESNIGSTQNTNGNNQNYKQQITIGEALFEQQKYDDAIVAFNKAIEIDPDYIDAYFNKGNAYYQLTIRQSSSILRPGAQN